MELDPLSSLFIVLIQHNLLRGGSRIFRRGGGGGRGGGYRRQGGMGCAPSRKAEKLLPLLKINRPDFVPFRRKSMSEIRMKAFRGILLILM